jgi:hypothetical protein
MDRKTGVTEPSRSPAGQRARGCDDLVSAVERSELAVACLSAAERNDVPPGFTTAQVLPREALPGQVALAPSWWADRSTGTDVDRRVLMWIASHVHNRKRAKSSLM